jgi:hypothetical protein
MGTVGEYNHSERFIPARTNVTRVADDVLAVDIVRLDGSAARTYRVQVTRL